MPLHRTVYQVEVLSSVPPNGLDDLTQIAYDITEGYASGLVTQVSDEEVTPERMRELLIAQGSDPSFLGLDEDLVTCDDCDKTSESGWGDTALCLDCEEPENICQTHNRTFVDECPICRADEEQIREQP